MHNPPPPPPRPPRTRPREDTIKCRDSEEQVLTPDKKHEGTDILVSEKVLPHVGV